MFPQFPNNPPDSFYINLPGIFGVNQDVIKVHNDKNIKFFYQNFIDIVLEVGGSIKMTEKHDLVFEMAIPHLKSYFPLVTIPNSHLIICICQVQLSKTLGAAQAIEQLVNQKQQLAILNYLVVESSIIYVQAEGTVFFFKQMILEHQQRS